MKGRLLSAFASLALLAVLAIVEPPYGPLCGFRWLTGLPCPLCGITRALFALAKGRWLEGVELHALSPVVLGLFVAYATASLARLIRPAISFRLPVPAWNALLCSFLFYGVFRILSGTPAHAQTNGVRDPEPIFAWNAEIRGRYEAFTGLDFVPERNDNYYLHRIRFSFSVKPVSWLRFFAQVHDAHAPGHREPHPASVADTFDLRQGYAELGRDPKSGWSVRLGRQDLVFGEERLVGAGNWGNVGRSFDAVRVSWTKPSAKLDWFASSVVVPERSAFDRSDPRSRFYGFYSSFTNAIPSTRLEPYFFWKSEAGHRNELGARGRLEVLTFGLRGIGKLPRRLDYGFEAAGQTGRDAGATIASWAGHYTLGYTLGTSAKAPRVLAQFNHARGDSDPKDGQVQTFDQLYPTNHFFYGIADRFGWRNMRNVQLGVQWKPTRKWKVGADYHLFWLGTTQDSVYLASGSSLLRNPAATSRRLADELDLTANYDHNEHFSLVFGYGYVIPRAFLKQSTPASHLSSPYAQWLYRF